MLRGKCDWHRLGRRSVVHCNNQSVLYRQRYRKFYLLRKVKIPLQEGNEFFEMCAYMASFIPKNQTFDAVRMTLRDTCINDEVRGRL